MDQTKLCEAELAAGVAVAVPRKDDKTANSWVTRLILWILQIIVAVSIFQLFKGLVFAHGSLAGSNLYLSIVGCTLATVCAYLLLLKYLKLIQQFSRDNVQLGERLGARTYALEKANEEMRREIAERGRMEKALTESESRFRTIIREAALGIALIDKNGCVIEGNPALLAMTGYTGEELQGLEFTRINHPENAASSWENFQQLLTGGQHVCRVETRYVRKDGWVGWGRQSISLVRDAGGKPQFAIALFEDITERRQSEEKIRTYQEQLQSLASELSITEDRERRRLATVLHDHIAQLLVVAKGKLEKIQESTLYRSVVQPMEDIRRLIEESIRYTRSLVFELSPPILYDLGFEPAMEWLAEHMQQQYGLAVAVEDDGHPKLLDNEARVLLFRAVRELLFNVLKHSQVNRARVCMRRVGAQLEVSVEDNGVGFAPDKAGESCANIEGFGLFSIRERLNYIGGRMEIESIPGEVTRVILSLPLEPERQKRPRHMAPPSPCRATLPPVAAKVVPPAPVKPRPPSPATVN
jgi:PAS domain S-box-containing protein